MAVADVLLAEVRDGLQRVRGAHVSLFVPVRQRVLERVLGLSPGVPPDLVVAIGDERRLQIRYGVFHANVLLHPTAVLSPAPVVTLELASQLVAWGLRRVALPPFVRVSGRLLRIHLAEVPALAAAAPLWRHVEQIAFDTIPGRLDVRVALDVT